MEAELQNRKRRDRHEQRNRGLFEDPGVEDEDAVEGRAERGNSADGGGENSFSQPREKNDARRVEDRLNDGREFSIVKVFYDPAELTIQLDALGWDAEVRATEEYFIYGAASRR